MRWLQPNVRWIVGLLAVGLAGGFAASTAHAQVVPAAAGVAVDANGVLSTKLFTDPTGQLGQERRQAAKAALNPKVAAQSKLRKISLNRLEEAIRDRLAAGQKPTDEMLNLAGLTRVEYVFCMPDTRDIVVAGPAEGWAPDLSGRICGIHSGRPIVELQDLIVALRAFPPSGPATPLIGCSIDPTQEGLKRKVEYMRTNRPRSVADAEAFATGLKAALGLQNVTVNGVPGTTHFAQVLVEADYRMKLIGIGLEQPQVALKTYVQRANPNEVSKNAMCRWWFVPNYECVRVADDELAMQLVGEGVKLVGADEVVMSNGQRQAAVRSNLASKAWCEQFTKSYARIAEAKPIYAQLRNLVDLAVAAAFIQKEDYCAKTGWQMDLFRNEGQLPIQTYSAPKQVETAINVIYKGNGFSTPIGGGVTIDPRQALNKSNLLKDKDGKVGNARKETDLKSLAKGQWWWD
ncbi:MAG TPA: DUF1598 domain-containing protein [Pirellulales bacterium]|jgi:hypothetical protein|nr:DUF1598 domain-containing protein [Pirellulales bacterium]